LKAVPTPESPAENLAVDGVPVSQKRKKLVALELIRGIAATWVLIHHISQRVTPDVSHLLGRILTPFRMSGEFPVIVFFVLSGFVITYQHHGRRDTFKDYLRARFTRIYPVYVFALLIAALYLFALNSKASTLHVSQIDLVPTVSQNLASPNQPGLFLGNLLMVQGPSWLNIGTCVQPFGFDGPLWSLSFEWWFYMAFFWLNTRLTGTKGRNIVQGCALVAILLTPFVHQFVLLWFAMFPIWWAGSDLAVEFLNSGKCTWKPQRSFLIGLVCSMIYLAGMRIFLRHSNPTLVNADLIGFLLHCGVFAIVSVIAGILLSRSIGTTKFNGNKFVARFGADSYALYVLHYVMLNLTGLLPLSFGLDIALGFIGAFLFADLAEHIVHPAAMKAIQKVWPRREPARV
jgi:peptidoglycan/LPS O-acetylase OafA/YrhL